MSEFKSRFGFGAAVRIIRSDERGEVVAVSFNKRLRETQLLVEYQAADARAAEAWFYEGELELEDS